MKLKVFVKKMGLLVLGGATLIGVLSGCGADTEKTTSSDKVTSTSASEPTNKEEGPISLKAVAAVGALNGDFNQMDILKRVNEETGIDVQFECIPGNVWTEKKNLMLASNDLPDFFFGGGIADTDINKYGPLGMIVALDDLLQYAPNAVQMLEDYPDLKKSLTSPDGKIYTLPFYDEFLPEHIPDNLFINKTWLDKLGLEIPKTTDEFYEVLKAFKEQDPNGNGKNDEIPFSYRANQVFTGDYSLSGAFGTLDNPEHIILKDGEMVFAPMEEGYKEAINWFNKLYKEGLIDAEIFTQDQSQYIAKGKNEEMIVGAFIIYADENYAGADRAYNDYTVIEPLIGPNGDQLWNRYNYGMYFGNFAITNTNKHPKETMEWVDKFFDKDISMQVHWGEVGKNLSKEGDKYTILEAPDGMSVDEYRFKTVPAASAPGIMTAEMYDQLEFAIDKKKKIERYELYDTYAEKDILPAIRFTDEELSEKAIISTDVNNYVKEMKAKWITGESDVNADWESYKEQLKKMGVDRYVEIYEQACERYK